MVSIDYISCLDKMYQGEGFPPYQWSSFDDSPWARFDKPLTETCVGLVSSAGIYREDQEPFDPWAVNDLSYREIPVDTPFVNLKLAHNYFDHRDALKDLNCVFPVQRLLEMESTGLIGRFARKAITLGMGRLYKRTALQNQTTPQIAAQMRRQKVDAILLVAA